jgi:hypothetical protein
MVTVLCRASPGTQCSPRLTEPTSAAYRRRSPSAIARSDSRGKQPYAEVDTQGGEADHRHVREVSALLELAGGLGHVAPFPHVCLPPFDGEVNFDELATDRLEPAREHLGIHAAQKRTHERQREPTRVRLAQRGNVHVIGRAR